MCIDCFIVAAYVAQVGPFHPPNFGMNIADHVMHSAEATFIVAFFNFIVVLYVVYTKVTLGLKTMQI